METIKSFIASMQQVRFYASVVEVRNQQGKIYRYAQDEFWDKVIPAWSEKMGEATEK